MSMVLSSSALNYQQCKKIAEWLCMAISRMITYAMVALITWVFLDIVTKGLPSLSWELITTMPANGGASGGILPALLGTILLIIISITVALAKYLWITKFLMML